MKITDDFHYKWKSAYVCVEFQLNTDQWLFGFVFVSCRYYKSCAYHKIDTFRSVQRSWKEGTGNP